MKTRCDYCNKEYEILTHEFKRKKQHYCCRDHYYKSLQKYSYNRSFFKKIDSEEKAYFLGLLYSDGHLDKKGEHVTIALQEKDVDILEKFIVALEGEIEQIKHKKKQCSKCADQKVLRLSSASLVRDLVFLGFPLGKKSHIITPPEISKNLLQHFWRGVFDGDGHVSFRFNKTNVLSLEMELSGNYKTCLAFKNFMRWENQIYNKGDSFSVSSSTTKIDISQDWFKRLYKGSFVFIQRKHNTWQTFFKERGVSKWKIVG